MNAVKRFDAFNCCLIPVESGSCSHCGKEFCEPSERNPLFDLTGSSISGDLPFGGSLMCANCIDELDRELSDLSHITGEQIKDDYIDTINWNDSKG